MGSCARWFWLARIMIGRSQQERTNKGEERGSVAIKGLRDFQPVSENWANQVRLRREIRRLWAKAVGQSHFGGVVQVVKTRVIVGIRIFSIVVG